MGPGNAGELISRERAFAVAEVMQALASPARVQILDRLLRSPCPVGELAAEVGMEQNTVSNHLRMLRHLGLVAGHRDGRRVLYSLHDDHVATLIEQALSHVDHHRPSGAGGAVTRRAG
ncbi:metalloregulator ArsR/SmtB family transcription factor [Streptomyces sp. HSW2009]|uniref:ArsR/SmtB family transcription factor n=1 Tax=Streptomyces sp. HSW2009 TaxID=3142890 RepID=UPI0032F0656C